LDSELTRFRHGDFFTAPKLNIEIEKPWLAEIKANEFKIIRTKLGLFKMSFSRIMVRGQIEGDSSKTIKLEIGIAGYAIFNFTLSSIALTLFLGLATKDLVLTLLLATGFLTIELLMLIVELNNTENKFMDYFEQVKSNEPQQHVCAMAGRPVKF
jgi:hypothetical protein